MTDTPLRYENSPRSRTKDLSAPSSPGLNDSRGPILLSPARNDSCAQLATLIHSNHTLSPFTRNFEHFGARSFPHVVARVGLGRPHVDVRQAERRTGDKVPVKAVRKRIHRIGGASKSAQGAGQGASSGPSSPVPSDLSDYFPRSDEVSPPQTRVSYSPPNFRTPERRGGAAPFEFNRLPPMRRMDR